ncbi:beta-lactamase family protein [Hydrogenispora ethanolica]|uniref:Beta-lactamase family protein n=1 Tax=Hydrogenispora ethanolica TaxID=1082276 RepID=A0A4V6NGZ7_HYDET|nr:beta-lactamase family protein [Hydrogenispora ethanolica]
MFAYVFDDSVQVGGGKPRVVLNPVERAFQFKGIKVVPVPVLHGKLTIFGYRIGRFAYITDCSQIPPSSMELLTDLELLILGVLRFRKHPTHFNLDEGLRTVAALKPKRAVFTHLCHDFKHSDSRHWLPEGVELGFDGEQIEVTDE